MDKVTEQLSEVNQMIDKAEQSDIQLDEMETCEVQQMAAQLVLLHNATTTNSNSRGDKYEHMPSLR